MQNNNTQAILVLAAMPALAALGFDTYLYFTNPGQEFMLTTPGYIWTHYHPASYKWVFENADMSVHGWIRYVLGQKSVIVGAAIGGFIFAVAFIFKFLNHERQPRKAKARKF